MSPGGAAGETGKDVKYMVWDFGFFLTSVLLGVGLAMDAFSISVAGGLQQPRIRPGQMAGRSGVFAFFQFAMPMVGWICVHTVVERFSAFQKWIPWIALVLLGYIGGKMLVEGLSSKQEEEEVTVGVGVVTLLLQGVATSIDALSVGFTIADYTPLMAFVCSLIIAVVTFFICVAGFVIGKTVGNRFSGKAEILGGAILIFIGLKIFLGGVL